MLDARQTAGYSDISQRSHDRAARFICLDLHQRGVALGSHPMQRLLQASTHCNAQGARELKAARGCVNLHKVIFPNLTCRDQQMSVRKSTKKELSMAWMIGPDRFCFCTSPNRKEMGNSPSGGQRTACRPKAKALLTLVPAGLGSSAVPVGSYLTPFLGTLCWD